MTVVFRLNLNGSNSSTIVEKILTITLQLILLLFVHFFISHVQKRICRSPVSPPHICLGPKPRPPAHAFPVKRLENKVFAVELETFPWLV